MMGKIFGSATEKPGNIVGLVILVSFAILAAILILDIDSPTLSKKDAMLMVAGFITVSLGFLFGRATS